MNKTFLNIKLISASQWDTDSWYPVEPIVGTVVAPQSGYAQWESDGGFFRGCSATLVWQVHPEDPHGQSAATLTITISWRFGDLAPTGRAVSSNSGRIVAPLQSTDGNNFVWFIKQR